MAWHKFARPRQNGEILLTDLSPAAAKSDTGRGTLHSPQGPKGKMGKAKALPVEVKQFMEKQKGQANFNRFLSSYRLSRWVDDHFNNGGTPVSLVEEIGRKVDQDPHHETLLEAQALLNELGRDPNHAELIRKLVNREKVQQIMSRGKR